MGLSSKPTSSSSSVPFRSISLPCRSHPSTDRIMKLLNDAKIWESTLSLTNPSAENICSGFSRLTHLYECLEDLLKKNTSHLSSKCNTDQTTDKMLDTCVNFLEICTNTTEIISQTLQHMRDLGCGLRRNRHQACDIENIIANFIVIRCKVKRDVKGSVASLKQVEKMICSSPCSFTVNSENNSLVISVFRAFREVTALSVVIFRLLLAYLSMPSLKIKSPKSWQTWARFITKCKVVPEEIANANIVNELQQLDATLFIYGKSNTREFTRMVPKKLEALEATLEGIDSHLHLISRRLIGTQASLLNMLSFY